jgi:PhzF family phenazine biosynthesis protein
VTMQRQRAFSQVDVFTSTPLLGNPVAVVHDGTGLSTQRMQQFTDWTNLSEATFILPPDHLEADYRVRIFCPGRELPFAGHPTLGTCHAWLAGGGQPKQDVIVQECDAGLVRIRQSGAQLAFAAPPLRRSGPLGDAEVERLASGLGLNPSDIVAHQWCDNGPGWQALLLTDGELVRSVAANAHILAGLDVGIVGPGGADGTDFEVRAFFPGNAGLTEDPVTGSLNAALAQWLIGAGIAPNRYMAAQGTVIGRAGRVHVEADGSDIWIGGECTSVITGTVTIP